MLRYCQAPYRRHKKSSSLNLPGFKLSKKQSLEVSRDESANKSLVGNEAINGAAQEPKIFNIPRLSNEQKSKYSEIIRRFEVPEVKVNTIKFSSG